MFFIVDALKLRLEQLKKERRAVILAHYYQRPEIQDVADYVGDSFGLSQQAAATDAEVIVFCGVHFMAESAAILSPQKIVLLPEPDAGCPLADMVSVEGLRALKDKYPDARVVSYVNTSAAVKAESHVCCTSSNALRVVSSCPGERIIFTPDRNLGAYVAQHTNKELILWEGYCPTHDHLTLEQFADIKNKYPRALTLVHPECRPQVSAQADFVGSTAGILNFAKDSDADEFIVATEDGILHQLQRQNPQKKFHLASPRLLCPTMKINTLEKVVQALETLQPRVSVDENIRQRAALALDRMLAVK